MPSQGSITSKWYGEGKSSKRKLHQNVQCVIDSSNIKLKSGTLAWHKNKGTAK